MLVAELPGVAGPLLGSFAPGCSVDAVFAAVIAPVFAEVPYVLS